MPALTLTLCLSAGYVRQVRIAIIQELGEDYVRLKRARGIRERTILFRGALKSALPSIFTIAGINIGRLLGGTAIIETVCTYQGIGRLAIQSITNRDYPLMQGYVLVMAGIYIEKKIDRRSLHASGSAQVKLVYTGEYERPKWKKKVKKVKEKCSFYNLELYCQSSATVFVSLPHSLHRMIHMK